MIGAFLLALALAGLTVLAYRVRTRRYRRGFRTSARRDDRLIWRRPHETISVALAPEGFDLPAGVGVEGQTVFLAFNVEATAVGQLIDPFIEVQQATICYRQFFERGAAGRRLLNLSPLFQRGDPGRSRHVGLRGRAIRWAAMGEAILCGQSPRADARTLVLAPHPDDAEIAAFGMYATRPSWVVTMTAGDRGTADLSDVLSDPQDLAFWYARLRVGDSLTIPQLGGVPADRCVNLAFPDGELANMHRSPASTFTLTCEPRLPRATLRGANAQPEFQHSDTECSWRRLVEEIRSIVEKTQPEIIVTPHPTLDAHPDHVFTTVALEQALRGMPRPPLVLLYSVHCQDAPLHPFGPADSVVSPPPFNHEEWIADSIYSHPLAPALQQAKYFAVEATHDLRTYSLGGPLTTRELVKVAKRSLSAFVSGMGVHPIALHRRAPRPNELYYIVDLASLSDLVGRVLAGHQSRPSDAARNAAGRHSS